MTHYLLDTNHLSPLVTIDHPLRNQITQHLQQGDTFAVAVPALTEFLFGILQLPRAKSNFQEWQRWHPHFTYYLVLRDTAEAAAMLQLDLRRQGWQLETIDALIATIALRYDLTLLTTDQDFRILSELKRDNWMKSKP